MALHFGEGGIKITPNTAKASQAFQDLAEATKHTANELKKLADAAFENPNDMFHLQKMDHAVAVIDKKTKEHLFTMYREIVVIENWQNMAMTYRISLKTPQGETLAFGANITEEFVSKMSNEVVRQELCKMFGNQIAKYFCISPYHANILVSNILTFGLKSDNKECKILYYYNEGGYVKPANYEYKPIDMYSFGQQPDISKLSKKLPGMDIKLKCPHCDEDGFLWNLVQHLNDTAKWTREQIADWLDEMADSGKINIDFQPYEETGVSELDGWK